MPAVLLELFDLLMQCPLTGVKSKKELKIALKDFAAHAAKFQEFSRTTLIVSLLALQQLVTSLPLLCTTVNWHCDNSLH